MHIHKYTHTHMPVSAQFSAHAQTHSHQWIRTHSPTHTCMNACMQYAYSDTHSHLWPAMHVRTESAQIVCVGVCVFASEYDFLFLSVCVCAYVCIHRAKLDDQSGLCKTQWSQTRRRKPTNLPLNCARGGRASFTTRRQAWKNRLIRYLFSLALVRWRGVLVQVHVVHVHEHTANTQ